jgi:hypothetical protein
LYGRYDQDWNPKVKWDCLTGVVQAAIAWVRAYANIGDERYLQAARKAVDYVKGTQNLQHPNDGIRGGVKGSHPFNGEYGRFEMLNWAAKFLCDAIMVLNSKELAINGIGG